MSEREPDLDLEEIERNLKVLERSLPARPEAYHALRARLEKAAFPRLVAWLAPRGIPEGPDARRRLTEDARAVIEQVCKDWSPRPTAQDVDHVARVLVADVVGVGPIQDLLDDPAVSEIMVNGPERVLVERNGRVERTTVRFRDADHLTHVIRKLAERIERHIDFATPTLDGRTADGSRVHAILPPVALDGPVLTIRKFGVSYTQVEDLVLKETLTPEMAFFLGACVKARLNLAVGGPAASGKTTTMNVLASQVPAHERMVTIEELAELDLSRAHGHVVRLQARTENIEGKGAVTIRQLVREALRMRADRIVVGEARGAEMVDVLQAMRCGHDGSMTTIHASSPDDLIERSVTISLFANLGLTEPSLRRMVVDALEVVVLMYRFADGQRKVVRISEPYHDEAGRVRWNDVFAFEQRGYDAAGRVQGEFRRVGRSRHLERFRRLGIQLPAEVMGEAGG